MYLDILDELVDGLALGEVKGEVAHTAGRLRSAQDILASFLIVVLVAAAKDDVVASLV